MKKSGWVYMLANKKNGTIYIGVTANLAKRIWQHQNGEGSEFCRRYGLVQLVWAEQHDDIAFAIAREKALKKWRRDWKITLIEELNPNWDDLSLQFLG